MAKWMLYRKKADFQEIAEALHISPVTARVIRNRDVIGTEETRRFLYGTMADLDDPADLPGLRDAAFVLKHKIVEGARIRVIGDYDVDGICSTYILWRLISFLGGEVSTAIPERIRDGYGINERLVREAIRDGVDTIITCDNGIAAVEPLRLAKEAGLTVIVTDHHEIPYREEPAGEEMASEPVPQKVPAQDRPGMPESSSAEADSSGGAVRKHYIYPPADVIAEPWIPDDETGKPIARFPSICGAAVVFKLAMLLLGRPDLTGPKSENEPSHVLLARELLGFAGIATVCDVMPLQDENRILVREGLKEASRTDNVGLRCLMQAAGLSGGPVTVYRAGFVIGPCLNASGRLDTAARALSLFQEKDERRAMLMARDLKQLNDSRKAMTEDGVKRALRQVETDAAGGRPLPERRILIVRLDDCHESLAGIIAGRLREQYHRPVIVLTRAGEETAEEAAESSGAKEGPAAFAEPSGNPAGQSAGTKDGPSVSAELIGNPAGTAAESAGVRQKEAAPESAGNPVCSNANSAGQIILKGSGRSVEAYDMFAEMNRCRELFIKFGGHKMAAGLTITAENAAELDRRLNASCALTEEEMDEVLHIDMELPPAYVTRDLVHEFELLEPCGNQNPGVLLATRNLILRRTAVFGKNRNVNRIEATDADGRRYDFVWFAAQERLPEALQQGKALRCNVVYEPKINAWKGRESVQFQIKDVKRTG